MKLACDGDGEASYTWAVVGRARFDTCRFHDMMDLRTAIAADIVRDLQPEQGIAIMFS